MHLYVKTGWLAVRLVASIDCSCLHPTKYPAPRTFHLFPHLVTFLRPPDPNAPALLVSPIPAAACVVTYLQRKETASQNLGYRQALTIYYVIIVLL